MGSLFTKLVTHCHMMESAKLRRSHTGHLSLSVTPLDSFPHYNLQMYFCALEKIMGDVQLILDVLESKYAGKLYM